MYQGTSLPIISKYKHPMKDQSIVKIKMAEAPMQQLNLQAEQDRLGNDSETTDPLFGNINRSTLSLLD